MKKLFLLAIVAIGFTAVSFGQASAPGHANAKATIQAAHSISLGTDLSFGIFSIINPASGGTITLTDAGVAAPINATAPAGATASSFVLTGGTTDSYTLSFPTLPIPMKTGTGATEDEIMYVSTWLNSTGALTGNLVGGVKTFTVGATLSFDGTEKAGNYVGEYAVTVNW